MTTADRARALFEKAFGDEPAAIASAPARANLLGEHTDYNDGFVLPTPLGVSTAVALTTIGGDAGTILGVSEAFGGPIQADVAEGKRDDWLDYPLGCVQALRDSGLDLPSLRLAVATDVPIGAGISSSAAFEVAVLKAVRTALDLQIDDIEIAKLAQSAERDFVGMPCGIMDQMAASVAQTRRGTVPGYAGPQCRNRTVATWPSHSRGAFGRQSSADRWRLCPACRGMPSCLSGPWRCQPARSFAGRPASH